MTKMFRALRMRARIRFRLFDFAFLVALRASSSRLGVGSLSAFRLIQFLNFWAHLLTKGVAAYYICRHPPMFLLLFPAGHTPPGAGRVINRGLFMKVIDIVINSKSFCHEKTI